MTLTRSGNHRRFQHPAPESAAPGKPDGDASVDRVLYREDEVIRAFRRSKDASGGTKHLTWGAIFSPKALRLLHYTPQALDCKPTWNFLLRWIAAEAGKPPYYTLTLRRRFSQAQSDLTFGNGVHCFR